ncbi:hypothetical protein ACJMK2_015565 [Sinanodonta woodiana]|uniref:Uncharacterized protein n=1 Tax=Sinanodonta woodiana TaxID=1069815 RepID=A0ABD3UQS1_SINWO
MVKDLKEFLKTAINEKADEQIEEQPEEECKNAIDIPCLRECKSVKVLSLLKKGIAIDDVYH